MNDNVIKIIEKKWELEPWREPKLQEGDQLVRSEHGRIAFNIDYRSHWFVLAKNTGRYMILVQHAAGEERFALPYCNGSVVAGIISALSSDEAYLLMHHLYDVRKEALRQGQHETAKEYRQAFVDGRLKKRKLPKSGTTKVWIEAPEAQ